MVEGQTNDAEWLSDLAWIRVYELLEPKPRMRKKKAKAQ